MAISAPKKGSKFNFSSAIEETVNKRHSETVKVEHPTKPVSTAPITEIITEQVKELIDEPQQDEPIKEIITAEITTNEKNNSKVDDKEDTITSEPKKEKSTKKNAISISTDKPAKEQVKALELNFSNPKVIMLTHELNRFFRIRAKQLGLTFTEYFNVLLWDYKENSKKKNNIEDIYDICIEKYSGKKERNNIFFTDSDCKYIEEETINAGVTLTQFACYLVGMEVQREETEGKRK